MSCSPTGCSTCGTESGGGCGTTENAESSTVVGTLQDVTQVMSLLPLETLIDEANDYWKEEDMHEPSKKELWELYFNTMAKKLAQENAANLKPLIQIFELDGAPTFIRVCKALHQFDITGHKIAWLSKYCGEDRERFISLAQNPTEDLLTHIDNEIVLYTAVNGKAQGLNGIRLPKKDQPAQRPRVPKASPRQESDESKHKKPQEIANIKETWTDVAAQYAVAFVVALLAFLAYRTFVNQHI